jgi:para-aminobenzoate synthetase component 1
MRQYLGKYSPPESFNEVASTSEESRKHWDNLPFSGGWVGYLSYDFGVELQPGISNGTNSLDSSSDKTVRTDKEIPLINMGLYQWALVTDHHRKTTTLYNYGMRQDSFETIAYSIKQAIEFFPELNEQPSPESTSFNNAPFTVDQFKSNMDYSGYQNDFKKIQQYIYQGDCYQVNFSQRFSSTLQGCSRAVYQKLAEANNSPFSAYLNFDQFQILSLSPERFIECRNKQVITQPIKGTRPRSTEPVEDQRLAKELKECGKDRAENLMIVDLLRNDLSRTAVAGSVKVKELFGLYSFESVHHLVSTVESQLNKESDAFDLLATTLPGGSITGAPKIRAMQIIEELENEPRGIYCGVVGYIDFLGNMDTNICIRTLLARDGKITCSAGGGLVADSEAQLEYQETFDKLGKILPTLQNLEA